MAKVEVEFFRKASDSSWTFGINTHVLVTEEGQNAVDQLSSGVRR